MGGETRLHIAGAGELSDIDLAAEADKLEADERRLVPSLDKDAWTMSFTRWPACPDR